MHHQARVWEFAFYEACDDLVEGTWRNMGELMGSGGIVSFEDLAAEAAPSHRGIYCVRVLR